MNLADYCAAYPEAKEYQGYFEHLSGSDSDCGMLQFNEETACCFGGPFPGDFAFYKIKDWSKITYWKDPTINLAQANSNYLEKHPSKYIDCPTAEKPVGFMLSGNDDTSYTKYFATIEEARAELALLEANQPLDLFKDLDFFHPEDSPNGGWVFTN